VPEVLDFPPGVVAGRPFTSLPEAVLWLREARDGDHGPMSTVVLGLDSGTWTTRPLLGRRWSSDSTGTPVDRVQQLEPDVEWQWFADRILEQWRVVAGEEVTTRALFAAASGKERTALAKELGNVERVLEWTTAQVIEAMNRWITTAWHDAINVTDDVSPNPINPPKPPAPAGYRLITP
jgi:hypothetical protein